MFGEEGIGPQQYIERNYQPSEEKKTHSGDDEDTRAAETPRRPSRTSQPASSNYNNKDDKDGDDSDNTTTGKVTRRVRVGSRTTSTPRTRQVGGHAGRRRWAPTTTRLSIRFGYSHCVYNIHNKIYIYLHMGIRMRSSDGVIMHMVVHVISPRLPAEFKDIDAGCTKSSCFRSLRFSSRIVFLANAPGSALYAKSESPFVRRIFMGLGIVV